MLSENTATYGFLGEVVMVVTLSNACPVAGE